jgi:hypothetical protein
VWMLLVLGQARLTAVVEPVVAGRLASVHALGLDALKIERRGTVRDALPAAAAAVRIDVRVGVQPLPSMLWSQFAHPALQVYLQTPLVHTTTALALPRQSFEL